MKKSLIIGLTLVLAITTIGCGNKTTEENKSDNKTQMTTEDKTKLNSENKQTFTVEELKKYDGQNGNKAYVAVDGKVYDVTNADSWKNGKHKSGVTAGNDLSGEINNSPHGKDVLKDLPIVGTLKQ